MPIKSVEGYPEKNTPKQKSIQFAMICDPTYGSNKKSVHYTYDIATYMCDMCDIVPSPLPSGMTCTLI